jgi:hypothetical protein
LCAVHATRVRHRNDAGMGALCPAARAMFEALQPTSFL